MTINKLAISGHSKRYLNLTDINEFNGEKRFNSAKLNEIRVSKRINIVKVMMLVRYS
mgnify:CR=1 FL=1